MSTPDHAHLAIVTWCRITFKGPAHTQHCCCIDMELMCELRLQVVSYAILDVLAKVVSGFLVVFADQAEEQYERLADGANESA